MFSNLR
jgi:hypothetical protein